MRDVFWILVILFVFIANLPWVSFFGWVKERRGKKYKSREDVI